MEEESIASHDNQLLLERADLRVAERHLGVHLFNQAFDERWNKIPECGSAYRPEQ